MKLIIQIPCYNEEATLGITLAELPREVPGVDQVEWLIINDGSLDKTVDVAREWGVDHVVSFDHNQGLAKGFMAGLEACLKAGADIIVNTDADNQYNAKDIPKLIEPILDGSAEIVVGARPILEIKHFSPIKKVLQKMGSWAVRIASKTNVADAPSGFRALSRNAAMQLNVFNEYTYTLETIIQAGQKGMAVASVPIRTNGYLRPSRLVKSIASYVQRSLFTILRIFITYRPLSFFTLVGSVPMALGLLLGLRWMWLYLFLFEQTGRSHVPSLIFSAILILIGFQLWVIGLVADLMSVNRKLLEDVQLRLRRAEIESHIRRQRKRELVGRD
ncbi:MAG: glycosyltransferase family 2 protein [Cyanobacteria bacterium P01_G01_bin.38]